MNSKVLIILYFLVSLVSLVSQSYGSESVASVKILVLGRTGSGKSTLINNILGRKITSVGHRPYPETTTVSVYKEEIYGVSVTVCDTPGLGDTSGRDEEYMRKIKTSCGDPDLVIFYLSMDNTRWHNDDEKAIKTVTQQLGKDIWEHSLLVLTFADKFITNLPASEATNAFNQRRSDLKQIFKRALVNIGVKARPDEKLYSAVSAKGCRHLPGVHNWMTALMISCLTVTHENSKEGFQQIILKRLISPHPEDEEPLTWTDSLCDLMQMNPVAWVGSILGMKAGGFVVTKLFAAKFGAVVGGPLGFILGGATGYALQYIISSATCSNLNTKDEL